MLLRRRRETVPRDRFAAFLPLCFVVLSVMGLEACADSTPNLNEPTLLGAGGYGGLRPGTFQWRLDFDDKKVVLEETGASGARRIELELDPGTRFLIENTLADLELAAESRDFGERAIDAGTDWINLRDASGRVFRYSYSSGDPPRSLVVLHDLVRQIYASLARCAHNRVRNAEAPCRTPTAAM